MVTQKFDLNMIPGKPKPIIRASQYDTGLRVFEVSLFAGTDTYTIPSGATLTVQGTKPDYTGFSYSATYSGNTVTFDCTDQMTACAGAVEMEIAVVNEGKRVATANFVLQVEPAALKDDTIISETDIPIIEQLPEMMEDVNTLISTFGGPNVAETAAEMTDQDKVYVYIGSETGYNSGHWYYYDKTAHVWKDGGIYQSAGVEVDNTLSIGGMAADAKATGDALALKADIASPTFTGDPKAPTASLISYNTQIANTEFVQRLVLPLDDAVNGLEPTEIEMHLVVDGTIGTWAQGGKTNIYDLLPGDNVEVTAGERDAYLVWYTTQGGSEAVNVSTSHTVTAGAIGRWGTTDARKLAVLMEDTSGNDVSPASFTINGVEKGLNERVDALETTKQDTLTFDTTPTEGSTNPVTSGGVAAKLTTLDDGLVNIGRQVNKTYYPYWERGGLDIHNNVIDVSNYNKIYRARTPIDHPIHLSKGDTIQTEDGFMFFCLYMDEGVAQSSTTVKRWTVPKDIDAYITVRPSTESGDEIPVETLANSISITYANGAVTKIQNSLYRVLSTAARNADAVETPTHRPCWADYSFVSGSYVLKLSGTLDTNANTRILLMKAHTINTADIIRKIYTGVVSDGATFYFDITEEEAAEVTCVCVTQYTALAISYTVELFGAEQYYWKIEKLTGDINDLILGGVPEYYVDHIAEKIREVNANTRFINGISFPFITDLHFSANSKNSRFLLKDVLDNTACDFVVCGGDYGGVGADAETSRSYIADLLDYASTIGHDKWFAINGNHDFTGSERLTWGETYNAIYRPSERWTIDGKIGGYFCIDNDVQKTRIICLNSCMPRSEASSTVMDGMARIEYDQYQYLIDKINEVSAYKIIVVSHIASDSAMSGYTSDIAGLQTVLELLANKEAGSITASGRTLNVDFTATTNTLICHICGHSHKDESHVSNGVLSISTTCDAHYLDDGHGAVAGTVTEQAFDVFCIDYDAETINAVRVGRGASRLWNKVNNEWVESV